MGFAAEIDVLIRARYPVIYLVTPEEDRASTILTEVASKQGKKLFEWSCTTGLTPAGTSIQSQNNRNAPTKEPLHALDKVVDLVDPSIFVFKDLHPYLNRSYPAVLRRIKEIALQLKNSQKTLIILSGVLELPPELEKEVTLLNLPLPDSECISGILDEISKEAELHLGLDIALSDEDRELLTQAALGLTQNEAENVFAKILVRHEGLARAHVNEILEEKRQVVRKDGLLEFVESDDSIESIGGLESLKGWLGKRTSAFHESAREFGLQAPKGVMLIGVQGCGKSLAAKAVANLWRLPLLRFDVGRMFGSLMGSSEQNVRRAIALAESIAPAVLWFDEIDKAFSASGDSFSNDGGTSSRVFGTLLTWFAEKTASVFVVATANNIANLPPELLRKGRLDEIFFVDLPTGHERESIFRIHLEKKGRELDAFDLSRLSALAHGFSGAEIEQSIESALFDAFAEKAPLLQEHVEGAIKETVPLSKTMSESIEGLRHWAIGRARFASTQESG